MLKLEEVWAAAGASGPAFRLTVTLLLAYALSVLYRVQFRRQSPTVQHLYFTLTGIALIYFNYGWDVYHSMIGVIIGYLLCKILGGTIASVIVAFIFYMGYVFVGFYFTATDTYDLKWTLPQCILTLRLIALVWDVYDGRNVKPDKMDEGTKETALTESPSLLEIAGTTYFYGSFLVGPQYSMRRYRDFVDGKFEPPTVTEEESRMRVKVSLGRLSLGVFYMLLHTLMYPVYPTEYFLTSEFKSQWLFWKYLIMIYWLRAIMLRYQAVWLAAEGTCILSGLAYNGRDKNGVVLWDAVRNMRMVKFEFGNTFNSVIESFNYNTNLWAAKYVFKRLRFLGNKTLSHIATLLFLSLWHGFYSGYFACFTFEFACVVCERMASSYFGKNNRFQTLSRTPELLFPIWLFEKSIVVFGCGFGFMPFIMLTADRWVQAYWNMYFLGWIGIFVTFAINSAIWRNKQLNLGILDTLM